MNANADDIVKGDTILLTCSAEFSSGAPVTLTMAGESRIEPPKTGMNQISWNVSVVANGPSFGPYECRISFDNSRDTARTSQTISATVKRM